MIRIMTRIFRAFGWVSALIVGALLLLAAPAEARDFSGTCQYFAGQAFKDRRTGQGTTLPMELAQDCVDALIYARSDDAATRGRALEYLAELQGYREVMVGMMVSRARERNADRAGLSRHMRPAVWPVSDAGAYLIARRMGLLETHADWTAWRLSLAEADPRFRVE